MSKFITSICIFTLIATNLWSGVHKKIYLKVGDKISVALASASDNDTIILEEGYYKEHDIIVDKPITILGINHPTIDGENKGEIFSIKSSYVTLSGLHIINCELNALKEPAAIKVYDTAFVTIEDNIIENNYIGIYLQYSRNCKVINNKIKSFGENEQSIGNGIHAWKCDSLLIIGNVVTKHRDGIYLEFVRHSLVWRNISEHNVRYGLHFMFSHQDAYITNIFRNNGAGVAVMFTNNVTMINNHFEDNWGDAAYGILLKDIVDSHIEGNLFRQNTAAMYADGMNRTIIKNNRFLKNGWGIKLRSSCLDNEITTNNFIGNTFDVSTNGTINLNTFDNNYWDKYEGYDLNKDKIGDIPFHPLSMFSVVAEYNQSALLFFRSFIIGLMDKSEKLMPSITPESFVDKKPSFQPLAL